MKKEPTADADIDELDDLLGGGTDKKSADKFGKKKEGMQRDTLGFLKQSEAEKKLREEQKKN